MRKAGVLFIALVVTCVGFVESTAAQTVAYVVPSGTVGNQDLSYVPQSLGMDFDVNSPISITSLGVFDSGGDGLVGPLRAHVYDRDTQASLTVLDFMPGQPGTLVGGSRFRSLTNPLVLPAGFHGTVVVDYLTTPTELNGNWGHGAGNWTTDSGGGLISFVGLARTTVSGIGYPSVTDGGPANRYAAGTFVFAAASSPPPQADYDLSLDFALMSNPNGVWSYGWKDTIGGTFGLLGTPQTASADNGVPIILRAYAPSTQPAIFHNDTTQTAVTAGEGVYPPETTWFAPGVQGQAGNFAVARLTIPFGGDGTYRLVTTARPAFSASVQLDTDFHVTRNNVEIFGAALNGGQSAGYTNEIALAAGDTIDFAVGRGADNSYIWSVLKITATLDLVSTNPAPPTIVSQPASQTVVAGTTVTFAVGASGSSPLGYQWLKGGTAINGATASTLILNNVQVAQSGEYSVVVSNGYGVATSQSATLTVNPVPPRADYDLSLDFGISSNPNGVWSYGRQETVGGAFTLFGLTQTNVANEVPILVSLMSPYTQPAILHNDTTQTAVTDGGATYPPETTWFGPGVQGYPGNYAVARFTVPAGGDGTYQLVTTARPAFSASVQLDTDFHVTRNNVEIFGAALNGGQSAGYTNEIALAAGDTIDFAVGRGADNSYIWSVLKITATLDLVSTNPAPPTIVSQPASQTVVAGTTVTFAVGASGSSPLSYQWRKGATAIDGATASTLTLNNVHEAQSGEYSVVVSNAYGVATSQSATLIVNGAPPQADYDLSLDFGISSNPNGVWSYGRQETVGGAFTLFGLTQTNVANGVPILVSLMSPNTQPAILHNDTTQTAVTDGGATYPPETTWFGPGVQGYPGNYAVARFTVPAGGDGTYQLATTARPAFSPSVQLDTDFHVTWNNVELFGAALNGGQSAGYTNTLSLAAGDTIDFAVGRGADNSYIWSVLKITATLTRGTNSVSGLALVVPKSAETNDSTSGGGVFVDSNFRHQQVYGSNEFPSGAILIRELRFRPDRGHGSAFNTTVSNIQINLSTTRRNPDALSGTYAENVGPDDTVVFHGPLSLSSQFAGPVNGPKAFDMIVRLSQPFLYDPARGHLVVDVRNFSGSSASRVSGQTGPDNARRVLGPVGSEAGTVDDVADTIQIVYLPGTNRPPPPPPQADYDLSRDFALTSNPNGVWSYGRQETVGGAFTLFGLTQINVANGVPILVSLMSPYTQPAILHNDTTQTAVTDGGQATYPPETTWFAPGVQGYPGNYAVARLTVPAGGDGTYQLVTTARPAFSASVQLDTDFHVTRNNVEIFDAALNGGQSAGYTNTLVLAAGDTIDFAVGRGADNSYIWSMLKITATLDLVSTNPAPPVIVAQPANQTVVAGTTVTFAVSVSGSSPLGYQWRKGATAIDGATASTLTLNNVQVAQSGEYSVVVSNAYGVVTSQSATLIVNAAPPQADYDLSRDFALSANPNGVWSYGWQATLGGELTLLGHAKLNYDPAGVPVEVWAISSWETPAILRNATSSTVVTDGGQGIYPPGTMWFYAGPYNPQNFCVARFTVPAGGDGTYELATTVRPAYDGPMQGDTDFHVVRNGAPLFDRQLAAGSSAGYSNTLSLAAGDTIDFAIGRGADNNYHGSGLKIIATLDLASTNPVPPTIVSQPASQTVDIGQTVSLGVGVRGSVPLSFQWRFNGAVLPEGTNSTLLIEYAESSDAGQYQVVVSNAYGSATSAIATVTVRSSGVAPTISSQPSGTNVLVGTTVRLNVQAVGTTPLSYQWFYNGVTISGGTSATLILSNAQPSQSGSYWVVVTNAFGSATSRSATVNIQESTQGGMVRFSNSSTNLIYDVDGITPLPAGTTYLVQLYAGPNASSLAPIGAAIGFVAPGRFLASVRTIPTVPAGQVATMQVKVWETAFGVTYEQAVAAGGKTGASDVFTTLTGGGGSPPLPPPPMTGLKSFSLLPGAGAVPPEITSHPVSQTVQVGQTAAFSVAASGPGLLLYQWRLDGSPLAGQTGATLSITNAQNTHAGVYSVVVRNNGGAVTSRVATLTVETSRILGTKALGSVTEGDLVAVPIDLRSNGDVAGMSFVLRYDPDFLSSPSVEWSPALDSALKEVNETALGELRFVFAFGSGTLATGTQSVATVNLRARSVIADAGSQLALQILDISDASGDPILYGSAAESGSVEIEDSNSLTGDNNGNGRLDVGDATLVLRLLALFDTTRPWDVDQNDLNENGVLDSGDAVKILRAVAGAAQAAAAAQIVTAQAGSGTGSAVLTPGAVSANPGSLVTFQVRLQGLDNSVAGASFTVNYPAGVLRLRGAQDYLAGSLVPQSAAPVWNAEVSGRVRFAASSSTSWPANSGVLAELTFEVLNPPAGESVWPVTLSNVEVTSDGYELNALGSAGATFSVRPLLSGLAPTGSGMTFNFSSAGGSYVIEASTDLKNWVTLTSVAGVIGSVQVVDPQTSSFPRRFYRACKVQ